MGEWISVTDRLPDTDGKYLVCFGTYNTIGTCRFTENLERIDSDIFEGENRPGWYDCEDGWPYEVTQVTHWMPLPEPPKGVSDESIDC